jgi:proline dehydrogenase
MLGEAAMTADDAARYLADYENAIRAIGRASAGRGIVKAPASRSSSPRSIRAMPARRRIA